MRLIPVREDDLYRLRHCLAKAVLFYEEHKGLLSRIEALLDDKSKRIDSTEDVIAKDQVILQTAPHVLMRPNLSADGTMWCVLYGDDLQSGVAGFGETPERACAEFDKAWRTQRTPDAARKAKRYEEFVLVGYLYDSDTFLGNKRYNRFSSKTPVPAPDEVILNIRGVYEKSGV